MEYQDLDTKKLQMEYLAELVLSQFENRQPEPVPQGLEFEEIKQIAESGQMYFLIYGALLKLDLPQETTQRLRAGVKWSMLRTLEQVCLIKELEKRLEEKGIRHQMLKGSVLKFDYPSPQFREMGDVDLIVYDESLERAEHIIFDMGFERIAKEKHHIIYKKAGHLIVELHWSLYDKEVDSGQHVYFNENFRAKLKPGTKYSYGFTLEDFYVYMISHMAKHFYENGCGIRNLVDIFVYNKKYKDALDYQRVEQELKKCGLLHFEKHMRKLSEIWLEKQQADAFYLTLFDYMVDCGIYGKGENGVWGQCAKMAKQRGKKSRGSAKLAYCFPGLEFMKEYYPWLEKYPVLLPWAWLYRGVNGIRRAGGLQRRKMITTVEQEKMDRIMNVYLELDLDFRGEQ